uniref:EF-hand domain-containing protein n=1 Tax=Plectus sambesii TaxID=2011161 RepID=A0A914XH33_9BILA
MNKCDQFPTKLELKLLMKQADKDQNGVITIDEFVDFMNTPKRCQYSSEELLEQFRLFDKDKDGFITREEMISIVAEFGLGGDFPRDVIDTLFQEADTDGDGMINLDEFVVAMK